MSVMIGIDPHKGSHAAAAVNGREVAVAELEVKASKRQIGELLSWAERFGARRWAIESANGHGYLLAQQLVAAGEHVVDVPSTLAARARVLDSTRSQKNDPNDARSVAIVALRQNGLRVVTAEDHVAVLRMMAKRHKQFASLKTQAASRLHTVLATLIPGGLGKEMVARQASDLLRRVRPANRVETERKRIAHQHLAEVRRLDKELKASRSRLDVAVKASGTTLTEIYGAGPIVAGPRESAVLRDSCSERHLGGRRDQIASVQDQCRRPGLRGRKPVGLRSLHNTFVGRFSCLATRLDVPCIR